MPKMKLTVKAIERAKAAPSGKQTLYWDTELKGFGLLVSGTTASKSYIVQRDLPGGRTRRVTLGPTNVLSLEKAKERAEKVLAQFYNGVDPKAAAKRGQTLEAVLDDYLASKAKMRESTKAEYRAMVTTHLKPWLKQPLTEITAADVLKRHRAIAAAIQEGDGNRKGEARANSTMRVLRALWNHADLPQKNPVQQLKEHWFEVKRRKRIVQPDQMKAFYKSVCALKNTVARDYLLLLLFTGLRREEAASLHWTDINLSARTLKIPAERTKTDETLELPLTDFVHDLLVARRALGDAKFVFPSNSKSGYIAEPKFPLTQVALDTGIKISAHDLRRTYITTAESCDLPVLALKGLVNHALGSDVTEGYVILQVERLREPAQRVANRLKELCGIQDVSDGAENIARLA